MGDPFEDMKKRIKIATAFIIAVYCGLFIWLFSPQWLNNFLASLIKITGIFTWIVPILFIAIASYFVIVDIHNWFDKKFFKERQKIGKYIRQQLTIPCNEINCERANRGILKEEENRLNDLFFTFIPNNDTERLRAFQYWGDYFITVNLSMLSTIGFIMASLYLSIYYFSHHFLRANHRSFIIIIMLPIIFHLLRLKIKKKLIYPTQAQTKRILTQDRAKLEERLSNYRVECQTCPLSER